MAQYPIKMLKDENGTPFVPLVAPEAVKDNQGTDWQALIDKKLEKTNIIAGDNITLSVSGNDITINSQAGGASDYTTLSNKPSLVTTSDESLNPSKEEINGEISLNKIAKTGNYKDLLYKPIIPITFTDNMKSDYRASELPSWQVSLLQQMINEYLQDNDSINNYILRADGIQYLEDSDSTFDTSMNYGKTDSLFTFKKVGPFGSIPHAFQFVGSIIVNQEISKGSGYSSAAFRKNGIMIYCDKNYKITAVCQRYQLYGGDKDNQGFEAYYISTYDSYTTAYIPTKDYQPATKKYVDDSINGKTHDTARLTIKLAINGPSVSWTAGTDNFTINYTNGNGRFISEKWFPTDITSDGEDKIVNIAKGTVFSITATQDMHWLKGYGYCTNIQSLAASTTSTEVTCFIYKDGSIEFADGEEI